MPNTDTPALILLSLLEAIRNLDTPVEDGLEELSPEIVSKRLGLSSTVAAQIERYRQAALRGDAIAREEAVQVFRLVGRRADAPLVFADAGRRAARHAVRSRGGSAPALRRLTPDGLARRVGRRAASRVARDIFAAELGFATAPEARMGTPISIAALPDGDGCAFYGAAFAELLRMLMGFEGAMVHDVCRGHGAEACVWHGALAEGYE